MMLHEGYTYYTRRNKNYAVLCFGFVNTLFSEVHSYLKKLTSLQT